MRRRQQWAALLYICCPKLAGTLQNKKWREDKGKTEKRQDKGKPGQVEREDREKTSQQRTSCSLAASSFLPD
jgi:hypothetical protein